MRARPDDVVMMMNRIRVIMTVSGVRFCELAISDDHDINRMRVVMTINGVRILGACHTSGV